MLIMSIEVENYHHWREQCEEEAMKIGNTEGKELGLAMEMYFGSRYMMPLLSREFSFGHGFNHEYWQHF